MARNRRRTRTLHKADTRPAAQTEAVFTPEQAVAIAQALASKAPVNGMVTALPRNPALAQIPFGPGVPLVPSAINPPRPDSGRPEPRAYDYPITANLPGSNEKLVPWQVLRQAADGVSMFRKCIEIRKAEVATLEWDIVISKKAIAREAAAAGSTSRAEVQQAMQQRLQPDIARMLDFWEEPDRRNGLDWIAWAKKALEERFVLDALAIYPRHTFGGDLYSLEIVDGSTIKPLLDEYGGRPLPPSAAYQQIVYGFPRGEFIADLGEDGLPKDCYPSDQLIYEVDNVRSWTPYGYSATERALTDGALYVQRNSWMLAEYTDGVMPSGWLKAGDGQADWSSDQLAEYERLLNDYYSGITSNRMRLRILPYGMEPVEATNQAEKYKPDYDLHLIKLVAGHFDTTLAELGFTEQGGLGSTGWHEGQADVQNRKATAPTIASLQDLITKISRRHLKMPRELEFKIVGLETDDEAAADEMGSAQYANGRKTLNEERDRLGLARYPFEEANKPFVVGGTGLIFIEGAIEQQKAAAEQAAAIADAKANPPAQGDDGESGQSDGQGDGPTKPKPGGDQGKALDKTEDADPELVKAELDAYTRWARKNPTPRRPFQFRYATPDHLADPDPTRAEFDGWVFIADTGAVLNKADFVAWNAAHPTHPRGPNGKFVKVGSELHEAALRIAREREHGGKAGHDNVERWDADPPKVQAARKRQERVDRARAFAEQLADMEENLADQHDTAEVVARVRSAADRNPKHEHLGEFASIVEGHQGDREAMLASARSWAAEHGLTAVGAPGERVTFDPAQHHAPPWMQREMRDGGMDQPMQIVRPGYRFNDPEGGEEIRLSKPAIDFPEEPAAAEPSVPRKMMAQLDEVSASASGQEGLHPPTAAGILAAFDEIRAGRGGDDGYVSLTELRPRLGGSRAEQDRVITDAAIARQIHITPEENQQTLTPADRDAAVSIGGEPKHNVIIRRDSPLRRGAPEPIEVADPEPLALAEPSVPGERPSGERSLYAPHPAPAPAPKKSTATRARWGVDRDGTADDARDMLDAATSREEASRQLDAMGLTAPELKQLARDLGVPFNSKDTKAKVRDRIIQVHVSTRLDSHAINPGKPTPPEPAPVHRPTAPPPVEHPPGTDVTMPAQKPSLQGDARGATLEEKIARAEVMFGADRSKWPAHAKRDLARAERLAARSRGGAQPIVRELEAPAAKPAKPDFKAQQAELQAAIDADTRAHIDADIAEHERLLAEAEHLDTQINFAESEEERAQLSAQRDRLDNQMAAINRRIEVARRGLRKADEPDRSARTVDLPKAEAGSDPKAQQPDQRWPAWTVDEQLAAAYTAVIATALAAGLTTTAALALTRRWLDTGLSGTAAAARWLEHQGLHIADRLAGPLSNLHTEAIAAGTRAAQAVTTAARPIELGVSLTADWGSWTPGDVDAARQILSADGHEVLLQNLLDRFGITVKSIAARRLDELAAILADGLEHGRTPDEIAQAVTALTGDRAKAYRIAITETARALSAAAVAQYEQDGIPTKGWMNAADQDVCQLCRDNEDAGDIPLDALFPSLVPYPPAHPHCFPAGVVVTGPSAIAATTRRYEGDLVAVVFADGKEVPVTPNHPVLTPDGWVPAGDLHEGAEVLRAVDAEAVARLVCPDDRQAVARIEDVAAALSEAGAVSSMLVPLTAEDFHGDGSGDLKVKVVAAKRHTQPDLVSDRTEQGGKRGLVTAERSAALALGEMDALLLGSGSPTYGSVGIVEHLAALRRSGLLPPQDHRCGAVATVDAEVGQHAVDGVAVDAVSRGEGLHRLPGEELLSEVGRHGFAPSRSSSRSAAQGYAAGNQPLAEGLAADAEQGRALADRLASFVELDRVVKVRRIRDWCGHVYNLETVEGWYFADGIIAHNCRCAVVPGVEA